MGMLFVKILWTLVIFSIILRLGQDGAIIYYAARDYIEQANINYYETNVYEFVISHHILLLLAAVTTYHIKFAMHIEQNIPGILIIYTLYC